MASKPSLTTPPQLRENPALFRWLMDVKSSIENQSTLTTTDVEATVDQQVAALVKSGIISGEAGADGVDGRTSYFHVAYADSADGSVNFNQVSGQYIGTYVDFVATDSTDYQDYDWKLFQGEDGIPGTNGENGLTSYLHLKYSDDGLTFTGNNGEDPGAWLGQYVDYVQTDSSNFNDYVWKKIEGATGPQGDAGTPAYVHIAYANSADGSVGFNFIGGDYLGTYTDSNPTDSTDYADYNWVLIKGETGGGLPATSVTPPAPTGLIAVPSRTFVLLAWDTITYGQNQHTIIYRSTTDNPATATIIGTSKALVYQDYTPSDGTYYYWIAFQSTGSVADQDGIIGPKNTDSPTISVTVDSLITSSNVGDYISTGAIGADYILASYLAAITANLGDVTAGTLSNPDGTFMIDLVNKYIQIAGPNGWESDDYTRIENGSIIQKVWTGTTHQDAKALNTIEVGTATNGSTVTLSKYYPSQPRILVTPYDTPIYNAAYPTQSQSIQIRAENITNSYINTTYQEQSSAVTLNNSGVVESTLTIQKTSGTVDWNASAYSNESHTGGCVLRFKALDLSTHKMCGVNTDPATDASYTSIDYCFSPRLNNVVQIYESGVYIGQVAESFDLNTVFEIFYDGTDIVYKIDGSTVRTVSDVGAGIVFYLDSSLRNLNAGITEIEFNSYNGAVETKSSLSLVNHANTTISGDCVQEVTITSNTAEKTAGSSIWACSIYSTESYQNCIAKGQVGLLAKEFVLGLVDSTSGIDNTTVDYGLWLKSDNDIRILENGVDGGSVGTASLNSLLEVEYKGDTINYYVDSSLVGTNTVTEYQTLYLGGAFKEEGAKISSIVFNEIQRTDTPYTGPWKFDAVSRLVLADSSGNEAINSSPVTGSGNLTSLTYTTQSNTTDITVYVDLLSVRGTGTAPNYYYRKITWSVEYRLSGSSDAWVPVTAPLATIGNTVDTFQTASLLVTFPSANTWEFRVTAVSADAGGTFSTGGTQYEYNTDNVNLAANTSIFEANGGPSSPETVDASFTLPSYSPPSGYSVYEVNYHIEYAYYLEISGTNEVSGDLSRVSGPYSNLTINHSRQSIGSTGVSSLPEYTSTYNFSDSSYSTTFTGFLKCYAIGGGSSPYTTIAKTKARFFTGTSAQIKSRKAIANSTTAANTLIVNNYTYNVSGSTVLSEGTLQWQAIL